MQEMQENLKMNTTDYDQMKQRNNKAWKIATVSLGLVTVLSVGALAFTNMEHQKNFNKIESERNSAQKLVKEYEIATNTKPEEIKEIVKDKKPDEKVPLQVHTFKDVKLKELMKKLGKNAVISGGRIFTNNDGSYAFADLGANDVVKEENEIWDKIGQGWANFYYRNLPNGEWRKIYAGNGVIFCKDIEEEAKVALRTMKGEADFECVIDDNVVPIKTEKF